MRKKFKKKATPPNEQPSIVIQETRIQSANRSRKDIGDFKMSLVGAESITRPNRTRLYDLYLDLLLDGHLDGIIEKRISAVLNKVLFWQNKDKTKNEDFDELIKSTEFRKVIRRLIEVELWGLSGMEFIPGPKLNVVDIPRKHIKLHKKTISAEQTGEEGIAYDGISNIWIIGDNNNLGKLLKCAPYAIWKRGGMADLSQFIEQFGQPIKVIKYNGHDNKTKEELKTVLDESGSALALMIPKEADFEMLDGKGTNANGDLHEAQRKACNEEMSIVILGNTETTNSSKSSGYAQGKIHQEQQFEITKDDMMNVRALLNSEQFLAILKSYGFATDNGSFEFEKKLNLDEVKAKVEIAELISDKVPIDDEQWYEMAGIAKPDNYDQLKREKEAAAALNQELLTALQKTKELDKKEDPTDDSRPDKKKKTRLSKKQKLMAYLADFFDHAH